MAEGKGLAESFIDFLSGASEEPVWLPVLTGSMAPTLIPGDEVLAAPCGWKECSVGEIIVFRHQRSLIAHRLIAEIPFAPGGLLLQQGDGMHRGSLIRGRDIAGKCLVRRRSGTETSLTVPEENRKLAALNRGRLRKETARKVLKWMRRKIAFSRSPSDL